MQKLAQRGSNPVPVDASVIRLLLHNRVNVNRQLQLGNQSLSQVSILESAEYITQKQKRERWLHLAPRGVGVVILPNENTVAGAEALVLIFFFCDHFCRFLEV